MNIESTEIWQLWSRGTAISPVRKLLHCTLQNHTQNRKVLIAEINHNVSWKSPRREAIMRAAKRIVTAVFLLAGVGTAIFLNFNSSGSLCTPGMSQSVEDCGEYAYQELNPQSAQRSSPDLRIFETLLFSSITPDRLFAEDMTAPFPVEKRIVRAERLKYSEGKNVHGGAGTMSYMSIFDHKAFETNWLFIHRGEIPPGGGIGEHIHRNMEEMFTILNHTAQFTVNGHTSQIAGGAMVLCQAGNSHAIYNNTDKALQWMNLAVSMEKGKYDCVNYEDDRSKAPLESPAPFLVGYIDDRLLQQVEGAHEGKGKLGFRRIYSYESFTTNWGFIDHVVLPPGTSIGYHRHDRMEECYMVIEGKGRATLDGKTFDVQGGDFILNRIHGDHGIYNNGDKDMIVLNMCVSLEKGKFDATNLGNDLSTW